MACFATLPAKEFAVIEKIFDRVRSFFTSDDEIVKTPRVIGPDEHRIDPQLVAWQARKTCEQLQARGFRAYIVGGAVRDLLLGVTPKDFDVVTDARPEEVKRCVRRAIIVGRRFQLVHVMFGNEVIECSTFRALSGAGVAKDATGRVVSDNEFGEMWEDAARRDFTCNALYYDPKTEELFDYHKGFEDIGSKRLRMIGAPEERYREDPVRMVRAVRIAAKLGFQIDTVTERPISKMGVLLRNVPQARLMDELLKILTCGHALDCVKKLREEGLDRELLPMLDRIVAEPEWERFLMVALQRSDERIAIGKKLSPFFLLGTLLWPQTMKRWVYNETKLGMKRLPALHSAALEILEGQAGQFAIQRRIQSDIYDLWMLQGRMERRTGKAAYGVLRHPRYRAAWDFLLLRSLVDQGDKELVDWWEHFATAEEDEQRAMLADAQREYRNRPPREDGALSSTEPVKKRTRRHRSHHRRKREEA